MIDPTAAIDALRPELSKLPPDKRLHFFASYALGLQSEPFEDLSGSTTAMISSWSVLKAVLDSLRIGVEKELRDAGADEDDAAAASASFNVLADELGRLRRRCLGTSNLDRLHHETDLLADVAGACSYGVSRALTILGLHLEERK